ncbi:hypothetical protein I4U23_015992 [Adineta vaga]|nr:hypothetical protein I4U23_015992 [Adineta vaga]
MSAVVFIWSALLTRVLQGYSVNWPNESRPLCKIRLYILSVTWAVTIWALVVASIDRFLCSSRSAAYRRLSSIRTERRYLIVIFLFFALVFIETIYCFEASVPNVPVACYGQNLACRISNDWMSLSFDIILPSIFLAIFGSLTIRTAQTIMFILFFVLFGAVIADLSLEWDKFKHDYNKQYKTIAEEIERKQIFIENVERMYSYQKTHPNLTFTMAINHFSDRRMEELGYKGRSYIRSSATSFQSSVEVKDLPESLDWRVKGVITDINNELGTIITAVVSTEVVESLHAIETHQLIQGSTAQVFDCCPQPIDAFDCIKNMSGICRKSDYPKPLGKCEPNKCQPFATFDTIKRLEEPDENKMLVWIQESTLWAEMNTAGEGFRTYSGGIYDVPSCSKGPVDYVVQIIGYGSEEGTPYWLGRLSWSENWGEKGYFRIARGKNMCGIANVVIQVANTKKSNANQQYTWGSIYFIVLLSLITQRIITYS